MISFCFSGSGVLMVFGGFRVWDCGLRVFVVDGLLILLTWF